jgi:threonine/homoserine/homoserine lactone efflux protein
MRVPVDAHSSGKGLRIQSGLGQTFVDGLFINLLNPLTLLGWIALAANFIAISNPQGTMPDADQLLVLLTILAGILTWQTLLVVFSGMIRQQIHWRVLKSLSLMDGACLILYGISAWISAAEAMI